METSTWTPVRAPCQTELRLIARHEYQFYNNLVVAGIYEFPASVRPESVVQIETYLPALKSCLRQHPFLSINIQKISKNKFSFARASHLDLRNHFNVLDAPLNVKDPIHIDDSGNLISRTIEHLSNEPKLTFFDTNGTPPPWRIDVLPLETSNAKQKAFVSFTYAHYIGDGMSGVVFHKAFLSQLKHSLESAHKDTVTIFETEPADLPQLPHLPITLLYLLGPALGHYLPKFLSKMLGLKASASGIDEGTWAGTEMFLNSPSSSPPVITAVETLAIEDRILSRVLGVCRNHNAKLSSFLNEVIGKCFSRHLPTFCTLGPEKDNFIACIPTNIRKLTSTPEDTIGSFASASYSKHRMDRGLKPDSEFIITEEMWATARKYNSELLADVSTLKNHAIGLLDWISDMDAWMVGHIGDTRDGTWNLSNLLSFEGNTEGGNSDTVRVEQMFFCQPGDVIGTPVGLNVISVRGGDLVICGEWQVGSIALDERKGMNTEDVERNFMRKVLDDVKRYLAVVAEESI